MITNSRDLMAYYKTIDERLAADLDAVFAKYDLKRGRLNASIGDGTIRFAINTTYAKMTDASGQQTDPEREAFKKYGSMFDLNPEWLDKIFSVGHERFRIAGLRIAKRRNLPTKVLIERQSDKSMRITTLEHVIAFMKIAAPTDALRRHVSGAIARGEATPVTEKR